MCVSYYIRCTYSPQLGLDTLQVNTGIVLCYLVRKLSSGKIPYSSRPRAHTLAFQRELTHTLFDPYTCLTDPTTQARQYVLLDYLISYNGC